MRPYAYVSHHIPGRMRIRIAGATPRLLDEFRTRIQAVPGVQRVETNPILGSILTLYSADHRDFNNVISKRISDLVSFAPESANQIGEYSSTAVEVLKQVKQADDSLRVSTSGRMDLKLLFPLAMLGLASVFLPTALQTPLWLTFLMFGYSSFESMHTGALEQPAGKSGEEHEANAAAGAGQG